MYKCINRLRLGPVSLPASALFRVSSFLPNGQFHSSSHPSLLLYFSVNRLKSNSRVLIGLSARRILASLGRNFFLFFPSLFFHLQFLEDDLLLGRKSQNKRGKKRLPYKTNGRLFPPSFFVFLHWQKGLMSPWNLVFFFVEKSIWKTSLFFIEWHVRKRGHGGFDFLKETSAPTSGTDSQNKVSCIHYGIVFFASCWRLQCLFLRNRSN